MKRENVDEDEEGEPPQKQHKYEPMPQQQQEQEEEHPHPPLNITKNVNGKDRDYYYLTTVNSLEEMNEFRFKNFCKFYSRKPLNICKSFTMPCARKKRLKSCDFELTALCPNLDEGIIHIYAHSQHSHVLVEEGKRSLTRRKKELVPDANPPAIFRTSDNIEWTFLETFSDQDKLDECRRRNHCVTRSSSKKTFCRIRFNCNNSRTKCKFKLIAMRTTEQRFHVYSHGEHEHNNSPVIIIRPTYLNGSKEGKQSTSNYRQQNEDEQEQMEEDEEEAEDEDEDEIVDLNVQDGEREGGSKEEIGVIDDEPPRNITKNVMGQIRDYYYLTTVKSIEELDQFRFKNYCLFGYGKSQFFKSHIMPCAQKRRRKTCNFELLAVRPNFEKDDIHVYALGRHDHPLESETKRLRCAQINKSKPMPAAMDVNPPTLFDAVDNIEWTFFKTFRNNKEMQEFRVQNQCQCKSQSSPAEDQWWRRFTCIHQQGSHNYQFIHHGSHNCQFMFLVIKNTKPGYHVYRHGQHNHQIGTSQIQQPAPCHQQQKEEQIVDDEEEREEGGGEDEEKDEAKIFVLEEHGEDEEREGGSMQIAVINDGPPRNITKGILDQEKEYYYLTTVKSIEELDQFRFKNYCRFVNGRQSQTWKSSTLPCTRKKRGKTCNFELLAVRPNLENGNGDIHVYAFSWHNHPLESEAKRSRMAQIRNFSKKIVPHSTRSHHQKEEQIVEDEDGGIEEEGERGGEDEDGDDIVERKVSLKIEEGIEENAVQKEGDGKRLKVKEKSSQLDGGN